MGQTSYPNPERAEWGICPFRGLIHGITGQIPRSFIISAPLLAWPNSPWLWVTLELIVILQIWEWMKLKSHWNIIFQHRTCESADWSLFSWYLIFYWHPAHRTADAHIPEIFLLIQEIRFSPSKGLNWAFHKELAVGHFFINLSPNERLHKQSNIPKNSGLK